MPLGTAKTAPIDRVDEEILRILDVRGRASYMELAAEVALSPNAVADRVRRLVAAKVIEGFAALIDAGALGLPLAAFVDVKLRSERSADEFERHVADIPGVIACTLTTGQFDYTVRVACRDQADLVRIVEHLRTKAGAAETYSRIILRDRRMPMSAVLPRRR